MRISPWIHGAVALAIGAQAASVGAAATAVRSYALPAGGALQLDVPMRWQESIAWSEGEHRPTITFTPRAEAEFVARIAVHAAGSTATSDELRALVAESARASLGLPPGADLALEHIGVEGRTAGWFYSVTDRSLPDPPPEGTFRVMTQGASSAPGVVLTATVLTQSDSTEAFHDAIALLRTARVVDAAPDAWRVPGAAVEQRAGLGQRYDLELPDGFELRSRMPLEARHLETGALLTIEVEERGAPGTAKDELRRQEAALEQRSPDSIRLRRRGLTLLDGKPAADLEVVDELRDEHVHVVARPLEDAALVIALRVHPDRAGAAAFRDVVRRVRLK